MVVMVMVVVVVVILWGGAVAVVPSNGCDLSLAEDGGAATASLWK
jgi:hypothetical protein